MNSFYTNEELKSIGFKSIGKNVLISKKCSIYNSKYIEIGNNVRIDDFCILSGKIKLGNYIHISAYTALYGGFTGIEMMDFSGISSRCVVYAESDDYVHGYLTNPMVPDKYRNLIKGKVTLEKHVLIGTGSTILPNVTIHEGASIGAMSLVNKNIPKWTVNIGIPCKKLKNRNKKILVKEKEFLNEISEK